MDAQSFKHPELFRTDYDNLPVNELYAKKQYAHGRKVSEESECICISVFDTWSANLKSGASLTAYEKLGFHANTSDLLRGFLDGPAKVIVFRLEGDGITRTVIKE